MQTHSTAEHPSESTARHFWEKVQKSDGCWLWIGSVHPRTGYGSFRMGSTSGAHRVSWVLEYGAIPDGLCVLHRCDVKRCVRPDHLFLGTHKDNTRDMLSKGRQASGDRNGSRKHPEALPRGNANGARTHPERILRGEQRAFTKLTAASVVRILHAYADGEGSMVQLAKEHGVNPETIRQIITGRTWQHVASPELIVACKERAKELGARLTPDAVREIRRRYAVGDVRQRQLAREYGVSEGHIKGVVSRRSHKGIPD